MECVKLLMVTVALILFKVSSHGMVEGRLVPGIRMNNVRFPFAFPLQMTPRNRITLRPTVMYTPFARNIMARIPPKVLLGGTVRNKIPALIKPNINIVKKAEERSLDEMAVALNHIEKKLNSMPSNRKPKAKQNKKPWVLVAKTSESSNSIPSTPQVHKDSNAEAASTPKKRYIIIEETIDSQKSSSMTPEELIRKTQAFQKQDRRLESNRHHQEFSSSSTMKSEGNTAYVGREGQMDPNYDTVDRLPSRDRFRQSEHRDIERSIEPRLFESLPSRESLPRTDELFKSSIDRRRRIPTQDNSLYTQSDNFRSVERLRNNVPRHIDSPRDLPQVSGRFQKYTAQPQYDRQGSVVGAPDNRNGLIKGNFMYNNQVVACTCQPPAESASNMYNRDINQG